jgi:hypothetical protein
VVCRARSHTSRTGKGGGALCTVTTPRGSLGQRLRCPDRLERGSVDLAHCACR